MANRSLIVPIRIEGLDQALRKMQALPKDANDRLRDKSKDIATALAGKAKLAATAEGHQAALMVPTIKALRDRVPVVQAGGTRKVGKQRVPAYAVLFGSEFGTSTRSGWFGAPQYRGNIKRQYKPHRGSQGYWFFPLIEKEAPLIQKLFFAAADDAVSEFVRGG